jgi:hypothetical protein
MTIATAVQKGHFVYVYDERGRQIGCHHAGSDPRDGLKGYGSNSVSIRRGFFIHTYDAKGREMSVVPAG